MTSGPVRSARIFWAVLGIEASAATWLAATPWLWAYHVRGTPLVLAVVAAVSVAVSFLTAIAWRRTPLVSYSCSLGALIVVLLVAVSLNPAELARGLVHGPSYLLSTTLPLTNPRWQLMVPVVLTWASGAGASELLVRSRVTGVAAVVLLASYVGAYALSSRAPGQSAVTGALLVVALAVLTMSRRAVDDADLQMVTSTDGPGPATVRMLAGWAALAVAAATVAWLVVPVLPGMGHHQSALARLAPEVSNPALAPVQALAALRDDDPDVAPVALFRVQTDGPSTGYFMMATLDDYDGDVWSFDRTFEPTGGRVPPAPTNTQIPRPGAGVPELRQHYTIIRSLGPLFPFLPYVDRPVNVSGVAVDVDAQTGMIIPSGMVRAQASYRVDSLAPALTLDRIAPASAVAPVSIRSDVQLPANLGSDLDGVLSYLADLTGQRPAPSISFLQAVVSALRKTDRRIDPSSIPAGSTNATATRGGTSLSEVINAVTFSQEATPEQFATLLVVVARSLGIPARLATGFRLDAATGASNATQLLTNRDAWTWAEIPVAGVGWVVADPTPQQTASSQAPSPVGVQTPSTTVAPPQANAVPGNATGGYALAPPTHLTLPRHRHRSPLRTIGIGLLVALAMLLAALVVVLGLAAARRAIRRQLRRSADPAALAVGAWLELLDDLWCVGVMAGNADTPSEVAEAAADQLGPELTDAVRQIGKIADQALYSNGVVDLDAARAAWQAERALGRRMRSGLPAKKRARAAVMVGRAPRRPIYPPPPGPGRRGPGRDGPGRNGSGRRRHGRGAPARDSGGRTDRVRATAGSERQ